MKNSLGRGSWSGADGRHTFRPVSPLNGTRIPGQNAWSSSLGTLESKWWAGRRMRSEFKVPSKLVVGCLFTFPPLLPSLDSQALQNLEGHSGCRQKQPQEKPHLPHLKSRKGDSCQRVRTIPWSSFCVLCLQPQAVIVAVVTTMAVAIGRVPKALMEVKPSLWPEKL